VCSGLIQYGVSALFFRHLLPEPDAEEDPRREPYEPGKET